MSSSLSVRDKLTLAKKNGPDIRGRADVRALVRFGSKVKKVGGNPLALPDTDTLPKMIPTEERVVDQRYLWLQRMMEVKRMKQNILTR